MKRSQSLAILAGCLMLALTFTNCSKDDNGGTPAATVPVLTTSTVTTITTTSAVSGGTISSNGGATVTAKGVVWGTSHNPTTADSKIENTSMLNTFIIPITGLTSNTTYYVRAYATNSAGTGYGAEQSFTTLNTTSVSIPTLTTVAISGISASGATSGGTISADGGGAITAKGVVWSTAADPTIADSKTTNGTGTTAFVSSLTGLSASTTYHVRSYATNSAGTAYGNDISFTTSAAASAITISISAFAFSPATRSVTAGTVVTWVNNDAVAHTVTSDNGTSFNSGTINPGNSFVYTASATGTFAYHCDFHGGMNATLTVTP
ncbi:MAG: cupredoxin domain-containing protein [Bacteroidota bacterium]